MPARDTQDGRGSGGPSSARLLSGLFWAGVGLAPVATLLVLLGQGGAPVRVGMVLALTAVVLIGLSVALARDVGPLRLDLEDLVLDEAEALRDELRQHIATAAGTTRDGLDGRLAELERSVADLRRQLHSAGPGTAIGPADVPGPVPPSERYPGVPVSGRAQVATEPVQRPGTGQVPARHTTLDPEPDRPGPAPGHDGAGRYATGAGRSRTPVGPAGPDRSTGARAVAAVPAPRSPAGRAQVTARAAGPATGHPPAAGFGSTGYPPAAGSTSTGHAPATGHRAAAWSSSDDVADALAWSSGEMPDAAAWLSGLDSAAGRPSGAVPDAAAWRSSGAVPDAPNRPSGAVPDAPARSSGAVADAGGWSAGAVPSAGGDARWASDAGTPWPAGTQWPAARQRTAGSERPAGDRAAWTADAGDQRAAGGAAAWPVAGSGRRRGQPAASQPAPDEWRAGWREPDRAPVPGGHRRDDRHGSW